MVLNKSNNIYPECSVSIRSVKLKTKFDNHLSDVPSFVIRVIDINFIFLQSYILIVQFHRMSVNNLIACNDVLMLFPSWRFISN